MLKMKRNKGVTLIALVVTIIVLLILAGVTIATLTGNNGILTKASEAKEANTEAALKEKVQMEVAGSLDNNGHLDINKLNQSLKEIEGIQGLPIKSLPSQIFIGDNKFTIYVNSEILNSDNIKEYIDGVPIPNDFYYVGGSKEEGIVISDFSEDKDKGTSHEVSKTLKGNQFVWIPVENSSEFKRYEGYRRTKLDNLKKDLKEPFSNEETKYNSMKNSVLQHKGFYIGRYEAGTDNDSERTENSGISDKVVLLQGKHVYNNIGWSNSDDMTVKTGGAVQKAQEFATKNGYTSAKSSLIYGIQWDAIMQFIDPNYKNEDGKLTSFVSLSEGKGNYSNNLAVTGSSDEYCIKNIYDLAGNANEWTMEAIYNDYRVFRGGDFAQEGNKMPASVRNYAKASRRDNYGGFRISLYL